jgi:hypothetical protein
MGTVVPRFLIYDDAAFSGEIDCAPKRRLSYSGNAWKGA